MRDIAAQLDSYQDHLDSLYPAVTPEEVHHIAREASRVATPRGPIRRPRLIAFAAAFAVIVGVGVLGFLIGSGEPADPADAPVPTTLSTVTSVPSPATTTPVESVDDSPTTTPAPATTTLSGTTLVEGRTAFPIPKGDVAVAIDTEGRTVVAYWASASEALTLIRCEDPDCRGEASVVTVSEAPAFIIENERQAGLVVGDMALRPDGSPIIVATRFDLTAGRSRATLYACADPSCTTARTVDLEGHADFPRLVIGPDGLARSAYYESGRMMLATCADPLCEAGIRSTVTIDDELPAGFRGTTMAVDSDGLIVVGYTVETISGDAEARVGVCRDDSCAAEPLTFPNATGPHLTLLGDGRFDVFYRSGPPMLGEGDAPGESDVLDAWDLMVANCDRSGCRQPRRMDADWRLLRAWSDDVQLLRTSGEETVVAFQYFSSERCAGLLTLMTLEPESGLPGVELGTYRAENDFDSATRGDQILLIFTGQTGALRIVEASTTDPIDAASSIVPQCVSP